MKSNACVTLKPLLTLKWIYMKWLKQSMLITGFAVALIASSCNNNNTPSATGGTANDSDKVDTRRNNTDTSNYLTKDSGNKSQDVVDPNPPQNSRY